MKKYLLTIALFVMVGITPFAQNAQAHVGIRIGIGLPLYVGPGPYYYGYGPYYYPPPAYVVPGPAVVYQTAPPTVIMRSPSEAVPPPPPAPATAQATAQAPAPLPPVNNVIPTSNSPQVSTLLGDLSNASETVRRDAAVELGRLKAVSAVDALLHTLAKDTSPVAREGAARGLGLIASPRTLGGLIYAAQADNDRDVRRSAQFAVEVIRSNLRN